MRDALMASCASRGRSGSRLIAATGAMSQIK
jgi:hypothetical protein